MDIFWNHTLHNYSFPKVTSSEFFFSKRVLFLEYKICFESRCDFSSKGREKFMSA